MFRLATRGGGEDRVFLWSGFRYVDSGSIARLGDDLAEELQRLGLWQDEAARVPRELEATTAEDFPAWIQFSLLPSLAGVQDALCLPEVQGISGIADERLTGHARGLLLQLLGKLEAEIHPSRMRRAPAVWDWLDSGKGGRPRTLLDCVEKRDQI